jgi:hypothetical protein
MPIRCTKRMAPTIHMIGAKEDWFSFQLFENSLHKRYYTAYYLLIINVLYAYNSFIYEKPILTR